MVVLASILAHGEAGRRNLTIALQTKSNLLAGLQFGRGDSTAEMPAAGAC